MFVVLFHIGNSMAVDKYFGIKALSTPFSWGHSGVPFFFVLSGFIIFSAHRNDIFKPKMLAGYIRKRFVRIYPTYWIIFLGVSFLLIASSTSRDAVPHDVLVLFKSLLLIPQDPKIVGGSGAPVLMVAWTLQYELFFYLYFALLILSRWLSITVGGVLLFIYFYNYTGALPHSFPFSFLSQDYVLLFVMGIAVSVVHTSKKVNINNPIVVASIGAVMFLFISVLEVIGIALEKQTLLYGLASCFIIIGLVRAEDEGRIIFGHRWMQKLGDSSFALYLIHHPLLIILCKIFLLIQINRLGILGAMIAYFAIFCTCLFSSVVFHQWIEKPIAIFFRNNRVNQPR